MNGSYSDSAGVRVYLGVLFLESLEERAGTPSGTQHNDTDTLRCDVPFVCPYSRQHNADTLAGYGVGLKVEVAEGQHECASPEAGVHAPHVATDVSSHHGVADRPFERQAVGRCGRPGPERTVDQNAETVPNPGMIWLAGYSKLQTDLAYRYMQP